MKEKVTLKRLVADGLYKVIALENRLAPDVGDVIDTNAVEALLIEAKTGGKLTVKIS